MSRRAAVFLAALTVCALAGCAASGPDTPAPTVASLEAEVAARAVHTMTPLPDGSLLVAGGCVVDGCATASDATFVVSAAGVSRGPSLANARDAHTATALTDGRVLVTGGFGAEGTPPRSTAEVFDPSARSWRTVGSMALGRGGHAAARLGDGRVLVAGGWVGPRQYTATTEVFDPATDAFVPGPSLPVAVDGLAATSLPDGCVLVVGGQSSPGVATGAAATVCADLRVRPVGQLSTGRFKHGVVTLRSGEVVVLGGTTDDRQLLASTEVYDPASRTFRLGPALASARYKLGGSVAALPDGRVVVAGGGSGVEVLDLATGSRRVAAAGSGRSSFSTVGVSASRVVVVGGYDEQIRLTRTFLSIPLADVQ
jgi:hypothetical protein